MQGGKWYYFSQSTLCSPNNKNVDYTVKIAIYKNNSSICQASRHPCPAGDGWSFSCKHVAALGFNLESFGLCGESMELVSKTSKPQRWHKPPAGRQVGHMTADQIAKLPPSAAVTINPARGEKLKCLLRAMEPSSPLFCAPNWFIPAEGSSGDSLGIRTRGQAGCEDWRRMRKEMITGSMLYDVLRTVESGKFAKGPALRQMEAKDLSNVPSIKWEKRNENRAIKAYEKVMGIKVKKCGLFQSKEWTCFGASPDGISEDGQTVIEVKCPYTLRFGKPSLVPYVPSSGQLKKKEYYAQVQA